MVISYIDKGELKIIKNVINITFIANNTKIFVDSHEFRQQDIISVKDLNWIKEKI